MKINIAVSGINAVDNPGPGTGIMRSLKQSSLDVRTIGLAYDTMEPGIYMDEVVDKAYLMPYPSSDRNSFLQRLEYIHSIEKINVIISALDAELPVMIALKAEIEKMGIKILIPTKKMFALRNKTELKKISEAIQVKSPQYISCTSLNDLYDAVDKLGFPCMIKGPFYEAFKVNSIVEAETKFQKIVSQWGFPIIAQKFIHGEEYDVIGLGDGTGKDLGIFAIKKMTTTSLGKVWNAISIHNENLSKATRRFVKHLEWQGGFEFEVLIENKTQELYLLEINPRFPAWVYMAGACGINLPERMVKFLLFGEDKFPNDYKSGKMMIRHTAEIIKDISDFEKITTSGELENNPIEP